MKKGKDSFYAKYVKRLLDVVLSLCALIVLSPVLLLAALLVRIKLGGPVIFKQQRPGKDEKIFTLYKFRSMTDEKDAEGNLLPDDVRLTKFGRILRATSLDELPELWNILKGDMSIVGPRPLLVEYLPLYNASQRTRHLIKPGLTGYAQISGRNLLTWGERFSLDIEYLEKMSLFQDIKIVANTVFVILKHNDINSATHATMEDFTGKEA